MQKQIRKHDEELVGGLGYHPLKNSCFSSQRKKCGHYGQVLTGDQRTIASRLEESVTQSCNQAICNDVLILLVITESPELHLP